MPKTLRIFISSPGDVGQERLVCSRVIERLQGEFGGFLTLEPVLWEHQPLRATDHFQAEIPPPSATDVMVVILWARLGTRLPDDFQRADGTTYGSGTEWEFEDAIAGYRENGRPEILVYRKNVPATTAINDEDALRDRLEQKKKLDAFIAQWFGDPETGFRNAFHQFDTPETFEGLVEAHLRRICQQHIPERLADDDTAPAITWTRGSPFRGLQAFDYEHAPVFFGRTGAVGELKDALARQAGAGHAFVLVLGASGGGKSSLVRAGLLPTLCTPGVIEGIGLWRWTVLRPGDAPFAALADGLLADTALPGLADTAGGRDALAALLRDDPAQAAGHMRALLLEAARDTAERERLAETPEPRFALAVDQLEEIFTHDALTADDRAAFVATLGALARSGHTWVVGTMRADFYHRSAEVPELVALKEGAGTYHLLPPDFTEIGQMIRLPARAAGLRFEVRDDTGERLDDVLHEAAARDTAALPLLSFTLDELFKARTDDGILTFDAYERLGGLEGALAQRAEDTFNDLSPEVQETLPQVLRALVTLGEGERATARRAPRDSVAVTAAAGTLVDAFVAARLLVVEGDAGQAFVRFAHEALLEHWPRLRVWLDRDREFLRVRGRVADAAGHWEQAGRDNDLLLPEGRQLAEASELLAQRRDELDPGVVAFIEASEQARAEREAAERRAQERKIRRSRQLIAVLSVLVLLAAGGGIYGLIGQHRAQVQSAKAAREAAAAREARDQARRQARKAERAVRRTEAARKATRVGLRLSRKQNTAARRRQSRFLADMARHQTRRGAWRTGIRLARAALPGPDGRGDRPYVPAVEAALYRAVYAAHPTTALPAADAPRTRVLLADDRTRLITAGRDGRARVWNVTGTPRPIATLDGHDGAVTAAALSPDGATMATGDAGGGMRLFSAADGSVRRRIDAHPAAVRHIAFTPDGAALLTVGADGRVRLWDRATGERRAVRPPRGTTAALAPGGERLVVGGVDGAVVVNAADGGRVARAAPGTAVRAVAFTRDGKRLLLGGADGTLYVADAADGRIRHHLPGHGAPVTRLARGPQGRHVLAAGREHAMLWDLDAGHRVAEFTAPRGTRYRAAAYADNGERIALGLNDGTVRLHDPADGTLVSTLAGPDAAVTDLAFRDGRVAAAFADGGARLWATRHNRHQQPHDGHAARVTAAAVTTGGGRAASGDADGVLRLWRRGRDGAVARVAAHGGAVTRVAFGPRDARLLTAGRDGTVRLWNGRTGAPRATLYGHRGPVHAAAFAPGGDTVATGGADGTVRLYDAASGRLRRTLATDHPAAVKTVAFDDAGDRLLAADAAGTLHVWNTADGGRTARLALADTPLVRAAFRPGADSVAALDATGRVHMAALDGDARRVPNRPGTTYTALGYAPGGERLVGCRRAGPCTVWDAATGTPLAVFSGHAGRVTRLAFDATGRRAVTAGADGTARLWNLARGRQLVRVRAGDAPVTALAAAPAGNRVVTGDATGAVESARIYPTTRALVRHAGTLVPGRLGPRLRFRHHLRPE